MRWPRPDWAWLSSLRGRLTLWNTAVVLLMTVSSLLAARLVARATLYDDADAELRAGAEEVVLALQDLYPDVDAVVAQIKRLARSHEKRGWFVQFLTQEGHTLWKSNLCPDAVADMKPFNLEQEENIAKVGPYRYVRLRIAEPGLPTYHVRVGTYTTGLDDRLTSLVRKLMLVGGALLLFTPLVGWWLARRATRPVADILRIANQLKPTRLGDRLPVRGTRDELDRLSSTINRLLDQVAGHVDRQRQFVADAAHELRGPLAAMQSALEVAASRDRTVEDYRRTIDDVLGECRDLARLTNDLLLLAEGESDSQAGLLSDLDLSALVRQSGGMFAGVAEERGIRLDVDAPAAVRVRGDARQLRQLCSNLLDNAIRFTPPGGRVALRLAGDPSQRQAVFTVEDTGRGIDEHLLPRVFDRFFQADAARDRGDSQRGGGLGLAICKSIIDRHGGTISVESRHRAGSQFTVRLPLA
ncbi:MAG: sensor histidine kinase [Planctomycetia bacterium]